MNTTASRWMLALGLIWSLMNAGTASAQVCSGHGVMSGGVCICNVGYVGPNCEFCAPNYYNYPNCTFCLASTTCSGHGFCTATGGCVCAVGYVGPNCSQCAPNYYNYPTCTFCLASTTCSGHGTCNALGGCNCAPGWTGPNCSIPVCFGDISGDGQVNVNDLLAVINSWGSCPTPPPACAADIAPIGGDGQVNVNDLLTVINKLGACL